MGWKELSVRLLEEVGQQELAGRLLEECKDNGTLLEGGWQDVGAEDEQAVSLLLSGLI